MLMKCKIVYSPLQRSRGKESETYQLKKCVDTKQCVFFEKMYIHLRKKKDKKHQKYYLPPPLQHKRREGTTEKGTAVPVAVFSFLTSLLLVQMIKVYYAYCLLRRRLCPSKHT